MYHLRSPAVSKRYITPRRNISSLLPRHCSEGGERGHLPRLGVLLLRPVAEPHPEQQRRDHAVLQDLATQRPPPPHGEIRRLRQPGAKGWGRLPRHQSRLRGL